MSVIAVCGLPGKGKTLFTTYLYLKHYKKDNRWYKKLFRKKGHKKLNVLYSNYPIKLKRNFTLFRKNKPKYEFSNQIGLFDMARWNQYEMNSEYVFDEFQLYFDSLDFKNFPQVLRNTFQLHRHFGISNIYIISQHPSRIVKQARVLVTEFYEITKFIKIPFTGIGFFRYNIYYNFEDYGKPVNVKKNEVTYRFKKKIMFFKYKKVFKAYDTKYFKRFVEDEDYLYKEMYSDLNLTKEDILNNYRI